MNIFKRAIIPIMLKEINLFLGKWSLTQVSVIGITNDLCVSFNYNVIADLLINQC